MVDKNILNRLIEENRNLFDMFVGLYTLLGSVKTARNVGISEHFYKKVEEDIENDLKKIKEALNIENSLENDEELKNFIIEWGKQFNWLFKDSQH